MNALSQSGNNLIDRLVDGITAVLPGPVLKRDTVIEITNLRKNETDTQKKHARIIEVVELKKDELDEVFQVPECEPMDDDEVREKAKALFSAEKLLL